MGAGLGRVDGEVMLLEGWVLYDHRAEVSGKRGMCKNAQEW